MIFKKYDDVRINGEEFQCIVADEEVAVMGKITHREDCKSVSYENCAIYPNQPEFKDTLGIVEVLN